MNGDLLNNAILSHTNHDSFYRRQIFQPDNDDVAYK